MVRGSPNGRATRGSLGRLLRIVRPRAEVGETPRAHLVEGPPIRAARVGPHLSKACVTPSRRALAPGGRLADILTIRVVSDLRPLSPNPLARARSNAPSSKLAPASSATDVTTYTVAAAEVLPPRGSPRVGLKESSLRLPLRFRCQLDRQLLSLGYTYQACAWQCRSCGFN